MDIQTISVRELREEFPRVRQDLQNGLSYLLIYRSRPIAELRPLKKKTKSSKLFQTLLNPPKRLQFQSKLSAVELVRRERD